MDKLSAETLEFLQKHATFEKDVLVELEDINEELIQLVHNEFVSEILSAAMETQLSKSENSSDSIGDWQRKMTPRFMFLGDVQEKTDTPQKRKAYFTNMICGKESYPVEYNLDTMEPVMSIQCRTTVKGNCIWFDRYPEEDLQITFKDEKWVYIGDKYKAKLNPWSMALYRLFVNHPMGMELSEINTTYQTEFVKLYNNICTSDQKKKT